MRMTFELTLSRSNQARGRCWLLNDDDFQIKWIDYCTIPIEKKTRSNTHNYPCCVWGDRYSDKRGQSIDWARKMMLKQLVNDEKAMCYRQTAGATEIQTDRHCSNSWNHVAQDRKKLEILHNFNRFFIFAGSIAPTRYFLIAHALFFWGLSWLQCHFVNW